jgi:hypothetical protein
MMQFQKGDKVTLWYVTGIHHTYFVTKIEAEAAARKTFPDEPENRRYARICYLESEPYRALV